MCKHTTCAPYRRTDRLSELIYSCSLHTTQQPSAITMVKADRTGGASGGQNQYTVLLCGVFRSRHNQEHPSSAWRVSSSRCVVPCRTVSLLHIPKRDIVSHNLYTLHTHTHTHCFVLRWRWHVCMRRLCCRRRCRRIRRRRFVIDWAQLLECRACLRCGLFRPSASCVCVQCSAHLRVRAPTAAQHTRQYATVVVVGVCII